ncbi:hypothetical protein [Desulfobacter latus]|uniref:Uncharacterized protein n=1 Tax=Desulfobacter latus TaxID=2292 RepID=A0A850TFZ1_9BACT|nr:hypothetical protein [Desulfobacter latus]NWH06386.1 hypothetical protein [Desulfobacter latus]
MEKCPACRALVSPGQTVCRRCKTDLSVLLNMETQAQMHRDRALAAFERQAFEEMFYHAKRSAGLINTPDAIRLMAGAAVLAGRYETALNLGMEI